MNSDIMAQIKEKVKNLPDLPGVYLMKDKKRTIIYVGKAKDLKKRVSSYFRDSDRHCTKVRKMVQNIETFDYIVTTSEFEALILECSLIKQHSPKYNILLKDDKGYSYLRISNEAYPRISEQKQKLDDGATYLGPYNSSYIVKQTANEVNSAFMLPTCSRKFPEEIKKQRPCLNFHIKQCMGVCKGLISAEDYNSVIEEAKLYIKNGAAASVSELKIQMHTAAEDMEFEKAARLRDRINIIERMNKKQSVVESFVADRDIIAFLQDGEDCCVVVLKYRNSRLCDKEDYFFGETDKLELTRSEFLLSYYNSGREIPPEISLDGEFEDKELINRYLSTLLGKKVSVNIPQRGDGHKLVQMARANAAEAMASRRNYTSKDINTLDTLAKVLGLKSVPIYIEAYDISNIGDSVIVGGMVVFENAKPKKSAYRKFNMKETLTRDDYASMTEMIRRRFKRYTENDSDESFNRLPDLILLDGGKGHVSTIAPILKELNLDIPIFGMVKDSRHRTRAVTSDNREIVISAHKAAFSFIASVQDEVHRYIIRHASKKHKKNSLTLNLTAIEGIGEKKAMEILRHFKTQKALKSASVDEIACVKGISQPLALLVYEYFNKGE